MTSLTKHLLVAAGAVTILTTSLVVGATVFAADNGPTGLATFLANKFHLNQTDVQSALNDYHTQEQANHKKQFQNRLDQAVTNGQLTAQQRDLIVAKQQEIQQKMQTIQQMTDPTQRKTALDQLKTDLQTWATQNKIDLKWLHPFGRGMGRHKGWTGNPPAMPSSATTNS